MRFPNHRNGYLLTLLLCLTASSASPQPLDSLQDHLEWAEAHHPRLEAARHQVAVAEDEARLAGALPDLKLGWGEMIIPVETRVGPQQRMLSISQSLPWFGTLGSARQAAGLRAAASQARHRAEILQVRREVYLAWFEVARLQEEARLVLGQKELLGLEESTTRAAYEAGQAPYSRLLRLQMIGQRLDSRLATLADALRPAAADLAAASGLNPGAGLIPAATLPRTSTDRQGFADLLERLAEENPELAGLRHLEESQDRATETARLQGRPGFSVGLDYIMTGETDMPGVDDTGKDPLIARLAVNVPLWSGKARARQDLAASRRLETSAHRRDLQLRLEEKLQRLLFDLRDVERQARLLEDDLLPSAHQLEEIARADYESGRVGFEAVLRARREILDLQIEALGHGAHRAVLAVELDILLGGDGATYLNHPGGEK